MAIKDDNRLIIVMGMAHSGTTVLTYVLKQHPDVVCCTNGPEAWIFENDYLVTEQSDQIQMLLSMYQPKMVLLKRPWTEAHHSEWLKREMPNARFIYCYRDFDDIVTSWSKPISMISDELRLGGIKYQREYYDFVWEHAQDLSRNVTNFRWHHHRSFVENTNMITRTAMWLGLKPWKFDTSVVGKPMNVKEVIVRESLRNKRGQIRQIKAWRNSLI